MDFLKLRRHGLFLKVVPPTPDHYVSGYNHQSEVPLDYEMDDYEDAPTHLIYRAKKTDPVTGIKKDQIRRCSMFSIQSEDIGSLQSIESNEMMTPLAENSEKMMTSSAKNSEEMMTSSAKNSEKLMTSSAKNSEEMMTSSAKNSEEMMTSSAKNSEKLMTSSAKNSEEMMTSSAKNSEEMMTSSTQNNEEIMTSSAKNSEEMMTSPAKNSEEMMTSPAKNSEEMMTSSAKNNEEMITLSAASNEERPSSFFSVISCDELKDLNNRNSMLSATSEDIDNLLTERLQLPVPAEKPATQARRVSIWSVQPRPRDTKEVKGMLEMESKPVTPPKSRAIVKRKLKTKRKKAKVKELGCCEKHVCFSDFWKRLGGKEQKHCKKHLNLYEVIVLIICRLICSLKKKSKFVLIIVYDKGVNTR